MKTDKKNYTFFMQCFFFLFVSVMLLVANASFADVIYLCGEFITPGLDKPNDYSTGKCGTCGQKCKRSPCYVKSGEYNTFAFDLQIPTRGFPLSVSRVYRSVRLTDGDLGIGWTSNLKVNLRYATYQLSASSSYKEAAVLMANGLTYRFRENADGTYTPPEGSHDKLIHNADATWDLTPALTNSHYRFSSTGALVSMIDDYGNALAYSYDGNGRLDRITDATGSGRYLQITYGADGRISSIQDHTGRMLQYLYDTTSGTLTTVIDPASHSTQYVYTPARFLPLLSQIKDNWGRIITDITYNNLDWTLSYTEAGEKYTYGYNVAYNQTYKTDSAGNVSHFNYDSQGLVVASFRPYAISNVQYNPDGSVMSEQDETSVDTLYSYNADGSVGTVTRGSYRFDYAYDANFSGRVISITPKNVSSGAVDPNVQAWRFDYYQAGSAAPGALYHVYRVRNDGVTLDTLATFTYNSAGQVLTATDGTGAVTTYSYDPATGDLTSVIYPKNSTSGANPAYNFGRDVLGRVNSITDPLGHLTSFDYDYVNRITRITLPKPSTGSPLDFTTLYSYDNFDSGSGLLFANRTDPNGRISRQGYNQFGQLGKSIDTAGNTTTFSYTRGLLTAISDANGNVTQYGYDPIRRVNLITSPDGKTESFVYYGDSLLNTKTDRRGVTILYEYDKFKRLIKKNYPNSSYVLFNYTGQKLTSVVDTYTGDTFNYGYDSSYRLNSVTQGSRGTVTYGYDAADRIASYTVSGGPSATYSRYPDGSLSTIQWSPVAGQFNYNYTLNGQYNSVTFPNGQHRDYAYDDQGRLLTLANVHPAAGNLGTFSYGYDSPLLGQRTSMASSLGTTNYSYDLNYQLIQASYPNAAPFNNEVDSWTYDAIGNRLTNTVNGATTNYSYYKNGSNPLNGQRLQSDGTKTYTYDNAGNMISDGTNTYTWDYEGRLKTITGAGLSATYNYDYLSRRTSKTVNGVTTTYLYDGQNLIRDSGGSTADYAFGPSIDEPLAMNRNTTISYYNVDGLGSVGALNDNSGLAQNSYLYDAWGNLRGQTGTTINPFGYTGREFAEAGLYYNRARSYKVSIGRFIGEDPLGFASGPSFYAYVGNDPINYRDPTGLERANDIVKYPAADDPNVYRYGPSDNNGYDLLVTVGVVGAIGVGAELAGSGAALTTANACAQTTYVVYISVRNGVVQYVGITKDFAQRAYQHSGRFLIQPLLEDLSKYEARAVEQVLIEYYGLMKDGGMLLNKINSIAANNPIYTDAVTKGKEILQTMGLLGP